VSDLKYPPISDYALISDCHSGALLHLTRRRRRFDGGL
jgi:hypothetical protein